MNKKMADVPEEIINAAKEAEAMLVPGKSRELYEREYNKFVAWRNAKNVNVSNETVILAYMSEQSKMFMPSSLWCLYSKLKTMLKVKEQVDISLFSKVVGFLKKFSVGHQAKKSNVLTRSQIDEFLLEAPDSTYLLIKVVAIFGIFGACRRHELHDLCIDDVKSEGRILVVCIRDTKTYKPRTFTILPDGGPVNCVAVYKKYIALRPKDVKCNKLFMYYRDGRCSCQPVGINTFGKFPMEIAKFLKLPNPSVYTGHCFRRSSATILADSGANITALKRTRNEMQDRRSQEERIVAGAQQKQSLQEYEDRSCNLYEDQQQIPEVLEVESKPLLEVPLITLTHTQEDDFENRQGTTSEPGPSSQNPSVTVVCAAELSTMKSSSWPSETSEDPLALLSDPTYEPNTVRRRRFQNASKSVSLTVGPRPLSTRNEVTIEYFGGDSATNVDATNEYEELQQDGRNIEKVLLQLHVEKLLLEMENLKQERLKMEAEKRNIKLRNEILSLRIQLARPQDTISSSDHPTTTRVTRESSSNLSTCVSLQLEPSQNPASSASTKHVPLQEESLRISCVPQQSPISNIKSSQCQNSSPHISAKCQTYEHAARPTTSTEERTSKTSNEKRQLSSERVKEDNYKASSMPVKTSEEELTRRTRIDYSKSEQVSLSAPYLKEEGEEHFITEQALFYSAVHGERDLERDATRHSTLLAGSLDRSGLPDSSLHESDSILEVESMSRSKDLGHGREGTQRGGGFPISEGQSNTITDTMRTEQRKKSHGSFQHLSPISSREKVVGEVGSSHLHDVYSKKSESKRIFESADPSALDEEGAVVKKKRLENIERLQSSGVE